MSVESCPECGDGTVNQVTTERSGWTIEDMFVCMDCDTRFVVEYSDPIVIVEDVP